MSLLLALGAAGGPVNYVLTCAAGSYTYTGLAATFNRGYSLSCSAGSYVYAGNAATLTRGYSLTCASGAYVYTGNAATLDYVSGAAPVNYTLTCDAGAYVYSGQSATLTRGYTLTCDSGSYTYTGIDATLDYVSGAIEETVVGHGGSPSDEEVIEFIEYLKHKRKKKAVEVIEDIVEELESSALADEVQQITQKTVVTAERQKPAMNYQAILNDIESLKALIELYQQYLEEEELMVFLLAA